MAETQNSNIHLALVHFPVYNKNGEIVTSSVTTLDVHDISRICKTYDIATFYIVTPLKAQHALVDKIIDHWLRGYGAEYNPTRKEALLKAYVKNTLDETVLDIAQRSGEMPKTVVTDAREFPQWIGYDAMRAELEKPGQYLLVFGTGWGLERGVVKRADFVLYPIKGRGDYNHLPVRAAIAIILDRLLAGRR